MDLLLPVSLFVLAQGIPPNPAALPPSVDHMILQRPLGTPTAYQKFMRTPSAERRARFEKLPATERSAVMRTHIQEVRRRLSGWLKADEVHVLRILSDACTPDAFEVPAELEKLRRAEDDLRTVVTPAVLYELQKLFPGEPRLVPPPRVGRAVT